MNWVYKLTMVENLIWSLPQSWCCMVLQKITRLHFSFSWINKLLLVYQLLKSNNNAERIQNYWKKIIMLYRPRWKEAVFRWFWYTVGEVLGENCVLAIYGICIIMTNMKNILHFLYFASFKLFNRILLCICYVQIYTIKNICMRKYRCRLTLVLVAINLGFFWLCLSMYSHFDVFFYMFTLFNSSKIFTRSWNSIFFFFFFLNEAHNIPSFFFSFFLPPSNLSWC